MCEGVGTSSPGYCQHPGAVLSLCCSVRAEQSPGMEAVVKVEMKDPFHGLLPLTLLLDYVSSALSVISRPAPKRCWQHLVSLLSLSKCWCGHEWKESASSAQKKKKNQETVLLVAPWERATLGWDQIKRFFMLLTCTVRNFLLLLDICFTDTVLTDKIKLNLPEFERCMVLQVIGCKHVGWWSLYCRAAAASERTSGLFEGFFTSVMTRFSQERLWIQESRTLHFITSGHERFWTVLKSPSKCKRQYCSPFGDTAHVPEQIKHEQTGY